MFLLQFSHCLTLVSIHCILLHNKTIFILYCSLQVLCLGEHFFRKTLSLLGFPDPSICHHIRFISLSHKFKFHREMFWEYFICLKWLCSGQVEESMPLCSATVDCLHFYHFPGWWTTQILLHGPFTLFLPAFCNIHLK